MPNPRTLNASHTQRGGSLVEFAMIAPLALIFLIGIVQFGIAMFEYHATSYAAKFGARYASVRGSDCLASGCPITNAALQTAVRNAVPGAGNANVNAQWDAPDSSTYAGTGYTVTCDATHQSKGCFVVVTVTNTVGLDIPFVTNKMITFTASSTEPIPL